MAVEVIDKLKPKNGGSFPIVDAEDVAVSSNMRLPEALDAKANVTDIANKANVSDVETAIDNLQGQINQIEISASAESIVAPEVAAARVNDEGTEFATLKERIDSDTSFLKGCLSIANCVDYFVGLRNNDEIGGVTFTWDGTSCYVNGTAESNVYYNFFNDQTSLPDFIKNGKTYHFIMKGENVEMKVWFYRNGSYLSGYSLTQSRDITIPANAEGMICRLQVNSGTSVDEYVTAQLLTGYSNDELYWKANNSKISLYSIGNDILAGSLYDDEGTYQSASDYNDTIYGIVSSILKADKRKVVNNLYSAAGFLKENGNGYSFLNVIKTKNLSAYDYLLTHFWTGDMNTYPVGDINATAGDGTLAGAVVELVNYMKTSNGRCKLILLSVPPVSTANYGNKVFTGNFQNGANLKTLDAVMHQLANKYQFQYVDWQALNLSYYYNNYRVAANSVYPASSDTYRAMGVYVANQASAALSGIKTELNNIFDNGTVSGSGNPVILRGTKATSTVKELTLTDTLTTDVLSVSGRNFYMTSSDMQARVNKGVRYDFTTNTIRVTSEGATGDSVSSGDNFNEKYSKVNGVTWWHNFKFMFANDTTVTISLNASQELLYDSKAQGQISDGTNMLYVDGNGLTFVAEGGVEYGFRLVVMSGFAGDITFKPQMEVGSYATAYEAFHGGRIFTGGTGSYYNTNLPIQEDYTLLYLHSADAGISITTAKMNTVDDAQYSKSAINNFNILSFGKTPFSAPKKPIITFIDDDTSSVALVERYHDIFAAKGVVGGYAVMTKNLNDNVGLADLLLDYEKEGFSCVYHCYYQQGDATRYWESGNVAYDEDLIRENFMRGLRDMHEYGFSAYKYWVTPYGVCDDFIKSLAKTHDLPCLFTMSGKITDNSFVNINGNCNRYAIPRISVSTTSNQSRTKRVIDSCIAANGWLTIVTHANTWGDTTTTDEKLAEIIQYCIDNGAEIVSVPEAYNIYEPYFKWAELLR